MVRYKVVFRDRDVDKCIFGKIESIEDPLIKFLSDGGNILWINKSNIVFMKEIL